MTSAGELTTAEAIQEPALSRRGVMGVLAGLGIGSGVMHRALAAAVQEKGRITPEMIQQAEWIAGLELTE